MFQRQIFQTHRKLTKISPFESYSTVNLQTNTLATMSKEDIEIIYTEDLEYLYFSQEGCNMDGFVTKSNLSIIALTTAENQKINDIEGLGEYFISCLS